MVILVLESWPFNGFPVSASINWTKKSLSGSQLSSSLITISTKLDPSPLNSRVLSTASKSFPALASASSVMTLTFAVAPFLFTMTILSVPEASLME